MWSRVGCVVLLGVVLCGAEPVRTAREGLLRADELFNSEKFIEAERLYLQVLTSDLPEVRRRAFDHLLLIYQKLPRLDSVIALGERYRDWLKAVGDDDRYAEVGVDVGRAYLALGHLQRGQKLLEECLQVTMLNPSKRMQALSALGQYAERRGDRKAAAARWEEVTRVGILELTSGRLKANRRAQIEYVWALAESFRAQKAPEKAVSYLQNLLPLHQQLDDYRGERETLRLLGEHYRLTQHYPKAEKALSQALQLHEQRFAEDVVTLGTIQLELGELFQEQKQFEKAALWRDRGIERLRGVLSRADANREEISGALAAFTRLQSLYIQSSEYGKALQLTANKGEEWGSVPLMQPRMKFEQGSLELILGAYRNARMRLRQSVQELEGQSPLNLVDYPRALNHLALVELATGEATRSQATSEKTMDLYRRHELPADAVLVDAHNLLGTALSQQGAYPQAIARFREGIALCDRIGPSVSEQRGSLLLNIALLMKAQSDLGEAMRYCGLAIDAFKGAQQQDSLAIVALQAALANMHATRGEFQKASEYARKILDACKRREIDRGPLIVTAKHCLALELLQQRSYQGASEIWTELLRLQEQEPGAILLPRTLNYLGACEEFQGHHAAAEEIYRRAEKLQAANPRSFPVTHFISLWGLANVIDRQPKRQDEAKQLLRDALGLAEKGRLRIYGDSQQRALYFGQFASAFELLVDWSIRDGDPTGALIASARSRGRNLLDHLEMANLDPREGLSGPESRKLLEEEAGLLQRISALRAQAQLIPSSAALNPEAKALLDEYDAVEKRYAEVYREILNASPLYRNFLNESMTPQTLATIRGQLGPDQVLLAYHVGRQRSYVFLCSAADPRVEVFPLLISSDLAQRISLPDPLTTGEVLRGTRGLVIRKKSGEAAPLPEAKPAGGVVALGQQTARALIDHFRLEIADESYAPSRGLVLKPRDPSQPVAPQRPDLVGNVFLPPELLARIRQLKPRHLVVIPDGPLHKIPLEAMVLQAGAKPRFAIDELPPIIYCPSVSILTRLASRPAVKQQPRTFLTLSNPAYPQIESTAKLDEEGEALLTRFGRLPLLSGSAREAKLISAYFEPGRTVALAGPQATEGEFCKAVGGKNIVHLAAHGFADERLQNLFGAIALSPPPRGAAARAGDDGFLSLFEIYRLPLQDCELAVLSACVTNVGPQQPLEAGVTLASGFLSAGARRVVASHWNVSDDATCDLMNTFFAGITQKQADGKSMSAAESLQAARNRVRANPDYRSPYYWAPFVLIGPGE